MLLAVELGWSMGPASKSSSENRVKVRVKARARAREVSFIHGTLAVSYSFGAVASVPTQAKRILKRRVKTNARKRL